MPKFITIGYGDAAGYDRTPQSVRDAAHAQDAKLRSEGAVIGIAGTPVQVRNPEARDMETRDGPFMSSALPIAGFAIIEAPDLAAAIEKVSHVPCAVAHGVVEVWPLKEAKF
ncbi:YciI family protein [Ensifer sp.]|uniref:YciI family protein n=1 Tax=Ensifer sp. TaxID=1872086 RepID=UPI0028A2C6B8|nr:YciI family protein [Ensifer sp.]